MTVQVPNADPPPGSGPTDVQQGTPTSQIVQGGVNANQGSAFVSPWAYATPPIDPQQPLREYASPSTWTPPSPGVYPPAYPGQPTYASPPNYSTPTYASPSYSNPPSGYGMPTYAPPSYGTPAYTSPSGYGMPTYAPSSYSMPTYASPSYGAPTYVPPGYSYGMPAYAPPGYGSYPWQPVAQPKRDVYLLIVAILAFIGSCLALLGGLASLGLTLLVSFVLPQNMAPDQFFASVILFLTLALAGLVGGGFCTYHSIRALFLQKPSRTLWLPRFWIFLLCYLAVLGLGYWLQAENQSVTSPLLTGLLIYLSALLPALTILALGIRRLRFSLVEQWLTFWQRISRQPLPARAVSRHGQWPTTWRRLVFALVSGATLSTLLAGVLELIIQVILLGSRGNAVLQMLNNPNINPDPSLYGPLFILLAVVAPIVEESVKPLAVVILIGRVRSKAEAFALGLACGIGFNLVETSGYISSGYSDWLQVALVRSGAGLLHGFGAAMVALGWYILTHKEEGRGLRRLLLGFGCGIYAVLQHALWNGSGGLALIPGPVGDFFQNWSWTIGTLTINAPELVGIIEMFGILLFFLYMAGRLRVKEQEQTPASVSQAGNNTYQLNGAPIAHV